MTCPKCGATAIQTRRTNMLEHMPVDMTTCINCGNIIQQEVVINTSERDMGVKQFACKVKHKKGCNVGQSCNVEGCQKDAHARGLCRTHYQQWRRYNYQLRVLADKHSGVINAIR